MKQLFLFLPMLLLFAACRQKAEQAPDVPVFQPQNAVYYWKTTFRLSDGDRKFIEDHRIKRLYLRYFDVYKDPDVRAKYEW
ncbi:MAG: hypothetical protein LBE91_08415 [Tannerella sp.]|jgi:hypothetical protein|nr:hypothetical protein [Tannerella sp.]